MSNWFLEWSECDLLQWWEELVELWNSAEFKNGLRSGKKVQDTKPDSEVVDEEGPS